MKKRVLSLLLSLALLAGMLPAAFAAEGGFTVSGGRLGVDYAVTDGVLHIKTGKTMTVSGGTADAPMTGSILVESGVTANLTFDKLYLNSVENMAAVKLDNAVLNLSMGQDTVIPAAEEGAEDTVVPAATLKVNRTKGDYPAVIQVQEGSKLAINAGGTLKIAGGGEIGGINGGKKSMTTPYVTGDIVINGGTIECYGDTAIGQVKPVSGKNGSITIAGGTVKVLPPSSTTGYRGICNYGGVINITGGDVDVRTYTALSIGGEDCTVNIGGNAKVFAGNRNGFAIGDEGSCNGYHYYTGGAEVNITGGTVVALAGGSYHAAIGGGRAEKRAAVNISGGTVTCGKTGASNSEVCGIGGDYCDVTISGGTVRAQGAWKYPGIGGAGNAGDKTYHGTVTITGGDVTALGGKWPGNTYQYTGAGIGTKNEEPFGSEAKITISGGTVVAIGVPYGIGEGENVGEGSATGWFSTTDAKTGEPGKAVILASSIGDGFSLEDDNWTGLVVTGVNYDGKTEGFVDDGTGEWRDFDPTMKSGVAVLGKVRGDVTLSQSLELPQGAVVDIPHGNTLTVAEDVTLTMPKAYYDSNYHNTTINNHGTVNDPGTLVIMPRDVSLTDQDDSAHFVNEGDGVFNWYNTVTGTMDTSAVGNIVNYPSTLALVADTSAPTYGDQVTFTATVSRVVKDANTAITTSGGVVDFYLDGAETAFASVDAALSGSELTAQAKVFAVGEDWKAGSKHTVTAKYRDGEGVTGTPKAQQLPAETAQGVEVTVGKKALDDSMVGSIDPVTFNDKAQEPTVTVTHTVNGKNAITAGDYAVTYADNVNAGTAKVTVKATDSGNYSGSVEKTFTIRKATSSPAAVEVAKNLYYAQANQVQIDLGAKLPKDRGTTAYTVTGAAAPVSGTPTVTDNGVLSFSTAAGAVDDSNTFTVTAEMQNYTDVTFTVKVTLKDKTLLTVSGVSVAGAKDGKRVYDGAPAAYTGTPVTSEASYVDGFTYTWYAVSDNGDTLLSAAPGKVGSYKLVVAVSDESELYRGQQTIPFTIEKAPLTVTAGSYTVSKEYDGTTAAGTAKGELTVSGVYGEDKVTVTAVPGTYAAKNAGDGLSVDAALTLGGADAGNYELKTATVTVPASIVPKPITISSASVADKTYDGKTEATVTGVTIAGVVNGETLTLGADYKAVAAFTDANAGTNKTAAVTLELLNKNYTMSKTAFAATASISKATPPAAKALAVDVANKFAKEYTVKLTGGLGALEDGCEYGEVRYTASLTYEMSQDTVVVTVKGDTLTLAVENIDSEVEYEKAFIVTVRAESTNYTDVSFDINVNTVNRTVPVGAPTVTGSLSYGQKLSELALAGTMKDGTDETKTVEGAFAWAEPDSVPAVADKKAVWVFTPEDTETYLEISGEADITVDKAVPHGTPSAEPIRESGKTLADAALSGEFTNPNNDAAVAGTLVWKDDPTTEVKANTDYEWIFTPGDGENYETVTGKQTLWYVISDNVPTGVSGGSSTTVKNEDGSVTKTVTNKRTGTVTETTTMSNGDKLVVETKKDGTVTETFTGKDGSKRETVTNSDGSMTSAVTTAEGVRAKSEKTAGGQVTASVTLPRTEKDATVTLPVLPAAPGKAEIKLTTHGAVKVVAPVTGGSNSTVAVLVKDDGTEEVIKASVLTEDGLLIPVSGGATIKVVDNSKTFNDVPNNSWYTESVAFVSAREMLNGTGENSFTPEAPTTRAMLMTILARYDGADTSGGKTWYEKGMAWAKEKGVSDGSNPDGSITREQLATMLYRYAGEPKTAGSLTTFQDASLVSAYAQEALKWAVEQKIVTGKGEGILDPLGSATRAEVAAMLERFVVWSAK